jgi:hypothetical protein
MATAVVTAVQAALYSLTAITIVYLLIRVIEKEGIVALCFSDEWPVLRNEKKEEGERELQEQPTPLHKEDAVENL